MVKKSFAILFIAVLALWGFKKKSPALNYPEHWPKPVYNFKDNPLTQSKIALGRALFYDPILSRDSTISCASCHLQYTGFTHVDHALSHGIEGRIGKRNSPSLINLAWNKFFMWDGAVNHLNAQALAPITNTLEMDENIRNVVVKLNRSTRYRALFAFGWGDSTATGEYTLKAIGAFMATLISCNSRYDRYVTGKDTLTEKEMKGYILFQKHCNNCHTEPLFTNNTFQNNGLAPDTTLNDIGRAKISLSPADSYKFKVPTLRNIEYSYPYMHDGRYKTLGKVMNHYSEGIFSGKTVASQLRGGLKLTSKEKVELIAFLLTLSDREFLFNPEFSYPGASVDKNK